MTDESMALLLTSSIDRFDACYFTYFSAENRSTFCGFYETLVQVT